jgi:hypothetical protein
MAKKSGKGKSKATKKPKAAPADMPDELADGPRRLKPAKYQSFRLQKRIKHPVRLPSVWNITKQTASVLWQHKKLFLGITIIYGLLNLALVKGFASSTDVTNLKGQLDQIFGGSFGSLASSLSIFVVLVSSAGNGSSQTAGAYQFFLAIIVTLAVIWALRQVLAGYTVRIRDAYYRGMYPLVPFLLVLAVIAIQLIPVLIGSVIYGIVTSNDIAVLPLEKVLWALIFGLLALLSMYMLTSSVFALYIVTLQDMTPMKALRSARELVRYRRWTVLRKILGLPVILLVVMVVLMLPIILWLTAVSQWVFFALTMFGMAAVHAYMYTLYRELLNE